MKRKIMKKAMGILLAAAIILTALPTAARADGKTVTIDLASVSAESTDYSYDNMFGIITVTSEQAGENDTVQIMGNGSSGYNIVIQAAKNILIDDGTTIEGCDNANNALSVPDGAVITGGGENITITGGLYASGIYSVGTLTISGTLGDITGGLYTSGIYSVGTLTISGTLGNITGGGEGGHGVCSESGITISGETGDITGGDGWAGGGTAIDASGGSVTVSGQTTLIQGGSSSSGTDGYPIRAVSYAVLDYTEAGNLLDIRNCYSESTGYTIAFDYMDHTPDNPGEAPKKAYVTVGQKIPAFPSPTGTGSVVTGWYKEAALTNVWNFESDAVTADITLYAAWVVVPGAPTGLSATAGDGSLTLSWTTPNDGGSAITKYQYSVSSGADNWQDVPDSSAATTGYTVTGLNNGTNYTVKVRAVNAVGAGAEAETNAAPVAPTFAFTVSADEGGRVTGTASGAYAQGTSISITAVPNDGYRFVGWMENDMLISRSADLSFTMPDGALTLTASFEPTDGDDDETTPPDITSIKATPNAGGAYLEVVVTGPNGPFTYQWHVDRHPRRDIRGLRLQRP